MLPIIFTRLLALIAIIPALVISGTGMHSARAQPVAPSRMPSVHKAIDSIPPKLFRKMFRSDKVVGSPGLAWKKQKRITVAFHGGSLPVYQLIEQTANEWTALGGDLSFSFKNRSGDYHTWSPKDQVRQADIRIGFDDSGNWSLLGVLAQNVEPGDPTMNYEGFAQKLERYFNGQNSAEWKLSYEHSTILHEFGHALGLSHEHFNSQCQQDLKIASVVAYLTGPPNNWSIDEARFNIDAKYYAQVLAKQAGPRESNLFKSKVTDQRSVMLYLLDFSHYKSGQKSVCRPIGDANQAWATKISDGDKNFYLANYRKISSPF